MLKRAIVLSVLMLIVTAGAECPMNPGVNGNDNNDNSQANRNENDNGNTDGVTGGDSIWDLEARITAFDPVGNDLYSDAIAAHGSTVAVASQSKNALAGVVDVYTYYRGDWIYLSRLERGEARFEEQSFGSAVTVSNSLVFVGAQKYAIKGSFDIQHGGVYVFESHGQDYTRNQILTVNDGEDYEYLGASLYYNSDQGRLIAGAPGRGNSRGAAYVFILRGGGYDLETRLEASDGINFEDYGAAVWMEGVFAAVGAPNQNYGTGAVYLYERDFETWTENQKILAPDGERTDKFGQSLAMDGNLLVIGAPTKQRPQDELLQAGAVYVYRRGANGYELEETLVPDDENAGLFGASVGVKDNRIAVGIEGKGRVLFYEKGTGGWEMTGKLEPDDPQVLDSFGSSLALENDFALVAARSADADGNRAAGAAYVFRKPAIGTGPTPGTRF